jgi:peptide/nickel transport system substrate-binding protein
LTPSRSRWPLFAALVAGIGAVALFWFVVLADPQGEALPASGGRYVEGVVGGPERINPLFVASRTDADLASLIFSGLIRLSPDGTPLPDLAERWEITGDGQSYVFHLRDGVAWHDGDEFDARDVAFTYETIASPEFRGDPSLGQLMEGVVVTARDDLTVEFSLEQAYAPFLAYLTIGILPRHLLGDLDADQLANAEFNASPVGTGPYRLKERSRAGVVLETNATYYLGPPKITTLELRVYPDPVALSDALLARQVDGALLPLDTPSEQLAFLRDDGRYALHALADTSFTLVYFDLSSPVFAEDAVRRALVRGLDVDAVIADAAGGQGAPAGAGMPPGSWARGEPEDEADASPTFNPGVAASMLEIAGWRRGRDGIRRKGDVRLSFALATNNDAQRVAIAENVAKQWRALGLEIDVQPLESETFVETTLLARKFEAALFAIDPGPDPDPYPFWHSSQIEAPGRNLSGYVEPLVDDALERGRQTTEVARRRELYATFAQALAQDVPALPLFAPLHTYVQSRRAQGFGPTILFAPASRFHNVHEWYVETRVDDD